MPLLFLGGAACVAVALGCGLDAEGSFVSEEGGVGPDADPDAFVTADACQGPACSACTCVAALPDGWTLAGIVASREGADGGVEVDGGGAPSSLCPAGWGSPHALLMGARAAETTCACSCGAGPNPCAHGAQLTFFRTGTVNCNDGQSTLDYDGGCHPLGFVWNDAFNGVGASPLGPEVMECPAQAKLPPILADGEIVVCRPAAAGAPCANGTCAPPAPTIKQLCAQHDGDVACPSGYPNKRVLSAESANADGRKCAACACSTTATTCSAEVLTFATNAACTATPRTATVDGLCNALSGAGTPTHYKFSATPNQTSCAPAAATVAVTGALSLPTVTLCCPN